MLIGFTLTYIEGTARYKKLKEKQKKLKKETIYNLFINLVQLKQKIKRLQQHIRCNKINKFRCISENNKIICRTRWIT